MQRLPEFSQDEFSTPGVGSWARDKYRRVFMYQRIFAEATKNKWEGKRTYVDLFAGPGCVRIRRGKVVHPGTPLLSMLTNPPFDRYVFCDLKADIVSDLKNRASRVAKKRGIPQESLRFVDGNVNDADTIDTILSHVPEDHLTLCFADPYSCELHFESIRRIGEERRVDFLILLALGMDANLNWSLYLDPNHTRLEKFLGTPEWRERWHEQRERRREEDREHLHPVTFLAAEYSRSMQEIGYQETDLDDMFLVRSSEKNLPLYYLAMFSRKKLAYDLWEDVLTYSQDQIELGL